ncbi:MAG: hypothetical protein R2941_01290 [Desulfobacterales bacterium]
MNEIPAAGHISDPMGNFFRPDMAGALISLTENFLWRFKKTDFSEKSGCSENPVPENLC